VPERPHGGPASPDPDPTAAAPGAALAARLGAELATPVPAAVERVVEAIRGRHGGVAAVLFYGSCLRRGSLEGVLDFYVLVDGYRCSHRSLLAAALGRLLPPNVFYIECPAEPGASAGGPAGPEARALRAKYAVISSRDFSRAASGRRIDCRIWSRFCQPARLVWARDADARACAEAAVQAATRTAVERMVTWLPGDAPVQRFRPAELWTQAFRETYRAELRGEKAETIDALYAVQSERFDAVAADALRALVETGSLRTFRIQEGEFQVESDPRRRARARRSWRRRRLLAKALATAGLLKTPLTFEGWAAYALWKVERHTGVRIELNERQRRRPILYAAPVLFRLLRQRALR
jgi:hypothetical protein